MKLIRIIAAMGCLLGFNAASVATQTCSTSVPESTPSTEFADHGDGTVTHSATGLMWKVCAENQTWSQGICTGSSMSPSAMTWVNALRAARNATMAGYTDWRLPNVKELGSIVERKCSGPAVNTSVFPNAPSAVNWSSSSRAVAARSAWFVNFDNGRIAPGDSKSNLYQVRLVRVGQPSDSFDAHPNLNPFNLTPILLLLLLGG